MAADIGKDSNFVDSRSIPVSLDAEKGVLSAILLLPQEVLVLSIESITSDYFYYSAHVTIYEAFLELWNQSKPIDLITVTQLLADKKLLDKIGGAAFLAELQSFLPTASHAEYYLVILKEKYLLRKMITVCTAAINTCYEAQGDINFILDEVEKTVFFVGEQRFQSSFLDIKEHVNHAIDSIEKLYKNRGMISGLSTGYTELDKMTDGLHPSEMIVIAARPSMGKTALAMNIVEHISLEKGGSVAIFSLEMSAPQLVQRLLCSRARVNQKRIRDGFLNKNDQLNLSKAANVLSKSKIYIDDTPGLSILEVRAKARRLKNRGIGLDLIVIDYLQLLRSSSKRAQENRQIEIAEISSGIKSLAKELNIPIIVLAQLNRESEKRGDGKPRLSDLRESGSIEQDADLVGLLLRTAYYAKDAEDREEKGGEAELIIAKQRNGPIGEIALTFLSDFARFESRAMDDAET